MHPFRHETPSAVAIVKTLRSRDFGFCPPSHAHRSFSPRSFPAFRCSMWSLRSDAVARRLRERRALSRSFASPLKGRPFLLAGLLPSPSARSSAASVSRFTRPSLSHLHLSARSWSPHRTPVVFLSVLASITITCPRQHALPRRPFEPKLPHLPHRHRRPRLLDRRHHPRRRGRALPPRRQY